MLAGRDLLRPIQGTWLGVTRQGRIAVLTNFREEGQVRGILSRGAMMNSFLKQPVDTKQSTKDFVEALVASHDAKQVGGFSLACGRIGEPLAIVSNRVSSADGIAWVGCEADHTVGLSNAAYGDRSWPKVVEGEKLMEAALKESIENSESEDQLVDRLLRVLSVDSLPTIEREDGLESYHDEIRKTIFVPAIGKPADSSPSGDDIAAAKTREKLEVVERSGLERQELGMGGLYGTQKQTVILVDRQRRVKFFERTLYDDHSKPVLPGCGDVVFEFMIDD